MKKIMNMQPKCDEVDKSNEKENNVVKNLQRAIESVLTPSQVKLAALANAKKSRACVQEKRAKF